MGRRQTRRTVSFTARTHVLFGKLSDHLGVSRSAFIDGMIGSICDHLGIEVGDDEVEQVVSAMKATPKRPPQRPFEGFEEWAATMDRAAWAFGGTR